MGEELTTSLSQLAERGIPRGAMAVLDDARDAAAEAPTPGRTDWRRGLVVAASSAAAVLVLFGATTLIGRPFTGDDTTPAITGAPTEPTTQISGALGPMNEVNDLALSPDDHLWAATSGGLVEWDVATGDFVLYTERDGVPGRHIDTVEIAPDGTVWTVGAGWIGRYDGSWQVFTADNVPQLNGQLGALAVDHEGAVWVPVASEPIARYDGSWSTVEPPREGGWPVIVPGGLAASPDGMLWVGTHDEGVFAFDGSSWRRFTEVDGAPARPWNVIAAPDGTVWAWGNGYYTDPELTGYVPATGFARYDGTSWTTFTVDDGLLSNEGSVVVAPDGTVWVVHAELGPDHATELIGLSRFDGGTWTTYPETDLERSGNGSGAVVSSDGTLWMPSGSGIVGFDGSDTTRLVVPEKRATPQLASVGMAPTPGVVPVRVSTVIGDFEFIEMIETPRRDIFTVVATPHGPVIPVGYALIWSTDLVSWQQTYARAEPRWVTTDGLDLIFFDNGFVRYSWNGSGWIEEETVKLPGAVQDIAFGPEGAVALVADTVYSSTDGLNFVPAEAGPVEAEPGTVRPDGCSISGASASVAGDGGGPILVTETGYVILAPRASPDWGQGPLCDPVVWFSADGSIWELLASESPFGADAVLRDVAAHDGRYVAIGEIGEAGAVWVSTDGVEWQRADVELEIAAAIAGGELGWFLTGDTGRSGLPGGMMWFSSDGLVWDGPYESPGGLGYMYFRTEPSVGADAVFSVNGTHDGLVIGRLQE
ncbi:MAG: hypothetical protein ABFS21_05925 [Actinomycetota bacterium]